MKTLKTTLACLFIALLWNVAATQTIDWFQLQRSGRVVLMSDWKSGHWATLFRCNMHNLSDECDPNCTTLISSYPVVVTRLGEHKWQVSFVPPPKP